MSIATNVRYEYQLRIAAYREITNLLEQNGLITKAEKRAIEKRISKMQDSLVRPDKTKSIAHDRDLSSM